MAENVRIDVGVGSERVMVDGNVEMPIVLGSRLREARVDKAFAVAVPSQCRWARAAANVRDRVG